MASLHLLHFLLLLLLFLFLFPISSTAVIRRTIRIVSLDDLKDTPSQSPSSSSSTAATTPSSSSDDSTDWDDFNDPDPKPVPFVDSGSWRQAVEYSSSTSTNTSSDPTEMSYLSGLRGLILGDGDEAVEESVMELEKAAAEGFAHAQSVMGFVYGAGVGRKRSKAKAMVYHRFAADGGNSQSKLALAYNYFRHGMYENSVVLYSELAEAAVASFMMSKDQPVIEIIRIHNGVEENKDALKKFRGEADEAFQVTEHQALRGDAGAMYKMGMFYYFGLRGVGRDNKKAFNWFLKAVEKGEPKSMELLGEIYASGAGVERNYTKALEWLTRASQQKHSSAFNGLGYLYVKGYGVEKNYTKAKIYFEKAANNFEAGGYYNLGVLYLKGIGVQRDVAAAKKFFVTAGNAGQPKALYQLGKMFQKGIGLKKNLAMATLFYKMVAERGPWSSLSTWALDFYLKGYVGKALLIYLRMAELGCEVAQSNAAWILDKYGDSSMCIGEFGFCTSTERHLLQHSLWWQASEQGNEHAALLIGDAYYYGRGMERDYDYAAEAYMQAQSQANSQAMFNLGYMHERGEGLPLDLHLAKRYYDQALERDSDAKLAVTLALTSLWVRKNYADTILVDLIDSLPRLYPRLEAWVEEVIVDEGNATILTLFVCLLTVLYLRERQRRRAVVPHHQHAEEQD